MANKVIITADSSCDLTKEMIADNDIKIIPLNIVIGGKCYQDWVNITPEELYDIFYETKELPKTTALSFTEYEDIFREYVDKGFDVVHLGLGSSLSSTYNNSVIASESFPGRVFTVDTQNLSTGSGLLVLRAAELRNEGLSAKEIQEKVNEMVPKSHASFVLERLDFMAAGGRCSMVAMLGANILKLRPQIEVQNNDGGSMVVGKKYRGDYTKCLLQYVKDEIEKYDNIDPTRVFVTHAGCDKEVVDAVINAVKETNIFNEILTSRAACTISSHCGPNTLGVLFMTK